MRSKFLVPVLLCASSGVASANGYVINEHDAQDTGRANATTATNTTASSIVYNIGGLAVGEGTQIRVGGALIMANGSFTPTGSSTTTDTDAGPAVLPQLYVSSRITKLISVGLGVHAPFGLAISWPDNAPTNDVVHDVALTTVFITPSVGVNLQQYVPGLSLGAGLDLVPGSVDLKQDIYFGTDKGTAHIAGDGFGIGGRIGAMYHPAKLPKLSIGAMWRSKVKMDFTGTGDFDAPAPYRSQLPPDGDASTTITLPQSVLGGVASRPVEKLS